jgi:hypothetical protein
MKKFLVAAAMVALGIGMMTPAADAQRSHGGGGARGGGFSGGAMGGGRGFSGGSPMGGARSYGGGQRFGGAPGASPRAFGPRGGFAGAPGGMRVRPDVGSGRFAGRPGLGGHRHHHRHWRGRGWYPGFYGPSYAWGYSDPYYYEDDYYEPPPVYYTRDYGGLRDNCRVVKVKRNGKWRRVTRCR